MPAQKLDRPWQAVLFDFDGVVVDSEPIYQQASQEFLEHFGIVPDKDFLRSLRGVSEEAFYRIVKERFELEPPTWELKRLGRRLLRVHFSRGVSFVPGFREFFERANRKWLTGVVTSTGRELVELIWRGLGWNHSLKVLVTGDDVNEGKPAPEPYLLAIERLAVEPAKTLVIEDSPVGVAAARAAGCFTVGLRATEGPPLPEADFVVADYHELALSLFQGEQAHEMV